VRYGNLNLVETTGQSPLHAPTEGRPETARRGIDSSAGTAAVAKELAEGEYERFRVGQDRDYEGDFEREAKRLAEQDPGETS